MIFSFDDFQKGWESGSFRAPKNFAPYTGIDPREYHEYKAQQEDRFGRKKADIYQVLENVEKRANTAYSRKLIPLARFTVAYAADTFPAFELIYPEVIADDWLSMTGWHKFQRDHLIHQPLTAYCVLKMLVGWNGEPALCVNGIPLLEHCVDAMLFHPECEDLRRFMKEMEIGGKRDWFFEKRLRESPRKSHKKTTEYAIWKNLFVEAAFMAAMFHDIGYPWQYVQRLSAALHGTNGSLVLHHGSHDITARDFKDRLLYCVLKGYHRTDIGQPLDRVHTIEDDIEKAFGSTHGLPGAFMFLLLSDIFRDYPREKRHTYPLRQLVVELASVAICMHDMSSIYRGSRKTGEWPARPSLRVEFGKDPISAVLCLADFMQEFERHQLEFRPANSPPPETPPPNENEDLGILLKFEPLCTEVELNIDDLAHAAHITFHQANEAACRLKKRHIKEDFRMLFSRNGYLDFSDLGITRFIIDATTK